MGTGRPRMRTLEAAAYLGSTKSTLEKWRVSGKGPRYIRLAKNIIVYDPDELDRFAEARTQRSTSENPRPPTAANGRREPHKPP